MKGVVTGPGHQRARRYYNAVVRDDNTKIRSVPSNVVANAFRFDTREFFKIEGGRRSVSEVDRGG